MAPRTIAETRFGKVGKRRLPPPPDAPMRVNFEDLPVRQVSEIERLAGVSFSRWAMAPSNGDQMAAVVSVMYEVDFDIVAEESARTLAKYVEIVDDDEEPAPAGEDDEPGN